MNPTQKKIRERFFLPGMTAKIITSVTNCISCVQKRNYVDKNQHVYHRSLESQPFQKIYVDLVGPLTPGEWHGEKVSYILTMMDDFTKWAEAIPVGDITAVSVAKNWVENWIACYEIPEQIHSNRGVQFTSKLYREVMRLFGILAPVTPPYNPRSNKVEQLHRILGEVRRSDQSGAEKDWPSKLPLALFAHRTTVSRTTGVTPFQALFGINSRIPL
jgi:transposase InsO family protein